MIRPVTGIVLGKARRVIRAGEEEAHERGQPMNIAAVDGSAIRIAFERMDGAWLGGIDIAPNQAFTARAIGIETRTLAEAAAEAFAAVARRRAA